MPKDEHGKQDQSKEQQAPPLGTEIPNSEFTKSPHTSEQEEGEEE